MNGEKTKKQVYTEIVRYSLQLKERSEENRFISEYGVALER